MVQRACVASWGKEGEPVAAAAHEGNFLLATCGKRSCCSSRVALVLDTCGCDPPVACGPAWVEVESVKWWWRGVEGVEKKRLSSGC